jgi:acetate kinase
MLAAALGGLDAFTAEIGESSAMIYARISEKLAWLGIILDPDANTSKIQLNSRPQSRVRVYVIPTDEELMIARNTLALLSLHRTETPHSTRSKQ